MMPRQWVAPGHDGKRPRPALTEGSAACDFADVLPVHLLLPSHEESSVRTGSVRLWRPRFIFYRLDHGW